MPKELHDFIARSFGACPTFETLAGMSGGRVQRVRGRDATAIVKHSRSPAEYRFYSEHADQLRELGVESPTLMLASRSDDGFWLLMEDIPRPLATAGADRQPDRRVLATLAGLHRGTRAWPVPDDATLSWMWTPEMSESAASLLRSSVDFGFAERLHGLEHESQALFEPRCWISGDPNPRNWGVRADGAAVLFDWELFGPGSPALDLAIIVPGLGNLDSFQQVVDGYAAALAGDVARPSMLPTARELAVAKATTVVRLLHEHRSGSAQVPDHLLAWLVESFPRWLTEVIEPD